jgi:hypothetical protein
MHEYVHNPKADDAEDEKRMKQNNLKITGWNFSIFCFQWFLFHVN